jgi:hypothetical protein
MKTNQGAGQNAVKTAAKVCIESCQQLAAQFERAKGKLLGELQETLEVPEKLFRLALNEAEALAWETGYPHLVFPVLATEKVQATARWTARQQLLHRKNSGLAMSI